jgi:ABC-type multidrug transport system ATPase subunit
MVNSGTIITALIACWLLCSVITSTAAEGTLELQYNVSVTTKPIKKKSKTILDQVSGYVSSGKLHAILGPSGCGKSTLLNLLSGNTPKNTLKLQGEVYAAQDKVPIFVQQEDLFFAQLTVEETLRTTANLRDIQIASSSGRKAEKSSIAGYILDLGLKKVRKSLVGDAKTRGISGGEKKRLSIGNELLSQAEGANVIYCDEPTSGLDSFQAQRVMQLLKDLTEKGTTVVTSIHQPRASIYSMFDEITLLSEGSATDSPTHPFILTYIQFCICALTHSHRSHNLYRHRC